LAPASASKCQHGRQLGIVVKDNRKTVTVPGDNGRQWRVSPGLLSPVKDVDGSAGPTRNPGNKKTTALIK